MAVTYQESRKVCQAQELLVVKVIIGNDPVALRLWDVQNQSIREPGWRLQKWLERCPFHVDGRRQKQVRYPSRNILGVLEQLGSRIEKFIFSSNQEPVDNAILDGRLQLFGVVIDGGKHALSVLRDVRKLFVHFLEIVGDAGFEVDRSAAKPMQPWPKSI